MTRDEVILAQASQLRLLADDLVVKHLAGDIDLDLWLNAKNVVEQFYTIKNVYQLKEVAHV